MPRALPLLPLLASLMLPTGGAAAAPDAARKAAICQGRTTCELAALHEAGRSPDGATLVVVEVHLGLADKPDDPVDGCRSDDRRDGGVEYWLLEGDAAPRQLFALCNDGYGAAGVGEDEVTIRPNRLVHTQSGGSAWRWSGRFTYSLAPWRLLAERDCSYHNLSEDSGTITAIDYADRSVRSITKDATAHPEEIGCPDLPAGAFEGFTPRPGKGLVAAYPVALPLSEGETLPAGTRLADCTPPMTTAGRNGFLVHGRAATAEAAAEIRVLAESHATLIVQVIDPLAPGAPPVGGSWVNRPHLEVWLGREGGDGQIGIELDGSVRDGVRAAGLRPKVERWTAHDEAGRPAVVLRLRWADDYALLHGVAVVYSQAEAGRQNRLVATTGIEKQRPLYLPPPVRLASHEQGAQPPACRIKDGVLSLGD